MAANKLQGLLNRLEGRNIGRDLFNNVLKDLRDCPDGEGLMALRMITTAHLDFGGSADVRPRLVAGLIKEVKEACSAQRRIRVIKSLTENWDGNLSDDQLKLILRALTELADVPCPWDLSSISSQIEGLVGTRSSGVDVYARSLSGAIRQVSSSLGASGDDGDD